MDGRTQYVLDDTDWDDATRLEAVRRGLSFIRDPAKRAETDIAWEPESWPQNVLEAATRLRDHHVPPDTWAGGYLQTGVVTLTDDQDRDDFLTFAPYALDATIWGEDGTLAELADHGWSFVVALTDVEADVFASTLEAGRLVTLKEWHERQPSIRRSLSRWFRGLGGRRSVSDA